MRLYRACDAGDEKGVALVEFALVVPILMMMMCATIDFGLCVYTLNNLTAALYETGVRSTGVGAQLGVGRLGGILGPYIGGWLQQLFPGSLALFLFMAGALAVSALAIGRIAPDTERRHRVEVANTPRSS